MEPHPQITKGNALTISLLTNNLRVIEALKAHEALRKSLNECFTKKASAMIKPAELHEALTIAVEIGNENPEVFSTKAVQVEESKTEEKIDVIVIEDSDDASDEDNTNMANSNRFEESQTSDRLLLTPNKIVFNAKKAVQKLFNPSKTAKLDPMLKVEVDSESDGLIRFATEGTPLLQETSEYEEEYQTFPRFHYPATPNCREELQQIMEIRGLTRKELMKELEKDNSFAERLKTYAVTNPEAIKEIEDELTRGFVYEHKNSALPKESRRGWKKNWKISLQVMSGDAFEDRQAFRIYGKNYYIESLSQVFQEHPELHLDDLLSLLKRKKRLKKHALQELKYILERLYDFHVRYNNIVLNSEKREKAFARFEEAWETGIYKKLF